MKKLIIGDYIMWTTEIEDCLSQLTKEEERERKSSDFHVSFNYRG